MPFFSPVSSEQFVAPPVPQPAATGSELATLSGEEPLPAAYRVDRIRLLAQSPRKLHLYWDFARSPFDTLRRTFGAQATLYSLVVRLISIETGEVSWHEAAASRSQWFNVQPDRSYRAEVGLFAQGRAFIRVLSSTLARTPRAGVARRAAPSDQFSVSPEEFARVLDEAGYASDALEVSLEAADLATHDAATRAVAGKIGGALAAEMSEADLAELRSLLVALALGMDAEVLSEMLSASLAQWLEEARREHGDALRAEHLLEILRSTLGIQTSLATFAGFDEAAMRRVARFVVGASEVNMPRRPFHIWMPSMNVGQLKRMNDER
jgi:hypothetical protein